ncbi:MAG: putative Signal transduction histidine kinase [Promethearchaeota archaeon]|nr:MAG: putative Signal transduction histidine kinase [Candidatus Lokiarchaeota archaeon]
MIFQDFNISHYILFHLLNPPIVISVIYVIFYFYFRFKRNSIEAKVSGLILLTICILTEMIVFIFFILPTKLIFYILLYIVGSCIVVYLIYYITKIIKEYSENILKAQEEIQKSEEKYKNAYNNAELYKDLFAHDVANMLQNFSISFELGRDELFRQDSNQSDEIFLDNIRNQINRGIELVKNARTLSKVDIVSPKLAPIEIISLLRDVIDVIKDRYKQMHIKIELNTIQKKHVVEANKYVKNVFFNLILNGITHNINKVKEIVINISEIKRADLHFKKIEFIDNGIGLTEEMKSYLAKLFSETDISKYRSGLGLILVKKIISNYGGELKIDDRVSGEPSKGSKFSLFLPIN